MNWESYCKIIVHKVMENQNKFKAVFYDYNAKRKTLIFYFDTLPLSETMLFETSLENILDTEKVIDEIVEAINNFKLQHKGENNGN